MYKANDLTYPEARSAIMATLADVNIILKTEDRSSEGC